MSDQIEALSSPTTVFFKFVFPVVWIGTFVLGTASSFLHADPVVREGRWASLVALVVGSVLWWFLAARLKRVCIDGDTLLISNYRREIRVPLVRVESVRQRNLQSPPVVVLQFDGDTGFGQTVCFIPDDLSGVFGWLAGEGSVARRLRAASEEAWGRPA